MKFSISLRTYHALGMLPLTRFISTDVACPHCQYNLRGLAGPIVNCPECGVEVNVHKLTNSRAARRMALRMELAMMPAGVLVLVSGPLALIGMVAMAGSYDSEGQPWGALLVLTGLLLWAGSVHRMVRRFGAAGAPLIVGGHASLCLSIFGFLLCIIGAVSMIVLFVGTEPLWRLMPVAALAAGAIMITAAARVDRWLRKRVGELRRRR